jgi:hypothetical protein
MHNNQHDLAMTSEPNTVSIIRFDRDHNDVSQIPTLFVEGMKDNGSPESYIESVCHNDLCDADSISSPYLSGRVTFLLLLDNNDD